VAGESASDMRAVCHAARAHVFKRASADFCPCQSMLLFCCYSAGCRHQAQGSSHRHQKSQTHSLGCWWTGWRRLQTLAHSLTQPLESTFERWLHPRHHRLLLRLCCHRRFHSDHSPPHPCCSLGEPPSHLFSAPAWWLPYFLSLYQDSRWTPRHTATCSSQAVPPIE
jgi:hypothetical protein